MKIILLITGTFYLIACNSGNDPKNSVSKTLLRDTIIKHDTIYLEPRRNSDWQKGFGLTHDPDRDSVWNKPVSYYLDDINLSPLATEFYYGYFRPSDNGATVEFFKYVTTSNSKLRPFYRWCLNKSIIIADGALWPYVGEPALQYAEKYPKEFFEYMDIDTSGSKYEQWTRAIFLNLIEGPLIKDSGVVKNAFIVTMKRNCTNCNSNTLKRIEKFVADCYE